jgi:hypothetical protein
VRRTLSRLAGRLLTGPVAFFVAFVIDVLAYAVRRGREP